MAKAKKLEKKSTVIIDKKIEEKKEPKKVEYKHDKKPDQKPEPFKEEKKEEKKLINPCLYKCVCNVTKNGRVFTPGSIIQLTHEQVDRILKSSPGAIVPAK
jgi:hypothetical protein